MNSWRWVATHTVAAMQELYQHMFPTKLYHQKKTGKGSGTSIVTCRMCGKSPESVPHVLAGCGTLAHTKYLARHNAALKILLFEMLKDLEIILEVPPWYLQTKTKPLFDNGSAQALWDVPFYADSIEVKANRTDARIVDKEQKRVLAIEMSCPWLDSREVEKMEKTQKYGPLMWELRETV